MLSPRSIPMNASGVLSRPSTIVSRQRTRPSRSHACDLGEERRQAVVVVGDDESAQGEPLADDQREVARARRRLGRVVHRDRAAQRDPPVQVASRRSRPRGARRRRCRSRRRCRPGAAARELLAHRAVLVVERGVEAELVGQLRDLLGRSGAADHPRGAAQLGDLAGHRCRPRRPRRRRRRCRPGASRRCRAGRRRPSGPASRARRGTPRPAPASVSTAANARAGPSATVAPAAVWCTTRRRPRALGPGRHRPRRPRRRPSPRRPGTVGVAAARRSCGRACTGRPT